MGRKALGIAALVVAALMALGLLANVGKGFGVGAFVLAGLFCVALPATVGVALLRSNADRRRLESADRAWDAELIRLAERRGGSLTVAEAMAHTSLSHEDAERRLDRLCVQGLVEHRVSDEGIIVYRFQPMLDTEQKRRAVGLLDD